MKPAYCIYPSTSVCRMCSLANYGRDCQNNPIKVNVAGNIRYERESAGLKQIELAELMGVNQARIANWEAGKVDPKASSLIALAEALKIEPGELLK